MQPFPHLYSASAHAEPDADVTLTSGVLPAMRTAPPAEFGGPGDRWSPETLFVAAIADCFLLTFRAVAHASKLPWISLNCDVDATLDRVEHVTQFTASTLRARLTVPAGTDEAQARRLLEKAERGCLVTNSLKFVPRLEAEVACAPAAEPVSAWHQVD